MIDAADRRPSVLARSCYGRFQALFVTMGVGDFADLPHLPQANATHDCALMS